MRIAVIGANCGLGLCLARIFANAGHEVLAGYVGQTVPSDLQELVDSNESRVAAVCADVTKEIQIHQAAAFGAVRFGQLDALIHVAGVILPSDRVTTIEHADLDDLRRTFDVNTIGPIASIKHFSPIMAPNAPFLVITSEGLELTNCGSWIPGYALSKAAAAKAVGIARLTANDVRYYSVHPGRMNTEMGRTTAQIEPEETAQSLYRLITEDALSECWYIDYKGQPMI